MSQAEDSKILSLRTLRSWLYAKLPSMTGNLTSELTSKLSASVSAGILKHAPQFVEETWTLIRHPRLLGSRIEEKSPWLNRQIVNAASNVAEPFLLGMQLTVQRIEEDLIEVELPGHWKNRAQGGTIHSGALAALGEYTARVFWERHLDLTRAEMFAERIETRVLSRPSGSQRGVFRISVLEREAVLRELRAGGRAEIISLVSVYNLEARLIAEVEISWRFATTLRLEK